MKELLRGESTISLEAALLKCPNVELYLYLYALRRSEVSELNSCKFLAFIDH
jgi:hypothetical protein